MAIHLDLALITSAGPSAYPPVEPPAYPSVAAAPSVEPSASLQPSSWVVRVIALDAAFAADPSLADPSSAALQATAWPVAALQAMASWVIIARVRASQAARGPS